MFLAFENINELQLSVFEELKQSGELVTTRGQKTIELTAVYLRLTNPRKRCTTLQHRNWNFPFAIGETIWHLSGSNELSFIEHYAKEWKNVSEDGTSICGSCYGYKIFNTQKGESQWQRLIKLFKDDIYTRRGVLDFYSSENTLQLSLKDVACTCTIQFLVRNNKLDATVYMRSNDIVWGLPNDIFFFTFLQEMLAVELGVELGVYNHIAGSLHLYERHFVLADKILAARKFSFFEMPLIGNMQDLASLIHFEKLLRANQLISINEIKQLSVSDYVKKLLEVLLIFDQYKFKKGIPTSLLSLNDNPYLLLLEKFIAKEKFLVKSINKS
ncbi:MAG: thymidylate synthase [Flavobacterium sp.]|nr:thymidylate synthase [Flavobacterium sp.]